MKELAEPAKPNVQWRRRPVSPASRRTFFFWLSVLGLGCLSMACVCWGASILLAQNGSENLLALRVVLPKLNISHGERKADAFRMSEPVPDALAHPKERATRVADHPKVTIAEAPPFAVHPVATAEPPYDGAAEPSPLMIAKVEGTAPVETCDDPVVYLEPCAPQRGDSPMMRNWKMFTLMSLMSAATASVLPPPIVFAQQKDAPVKVEGLDKLENAIKALDKRLDTLQKKTADKDTIAAAIRAELKELKDGVLADLQKDITNVRIEQTKQEKAILDNKTLISLLSGKVNGLEDKLAASPGPAVDKAFMEEMRKSIKGLEDTVAKLGPTKERISLSPPTNGNSGPKVGRVKLVNDYSSDMLFVINGKGYRVAPGMQAVLEGMPAGTLQYEVVANGFGLLESRVASLRAGETFTVTAR